MPDLPARLMRFRWYRWIVVIIGMESGNVTELPFILFRHYEDGARWVERMNEWSFAYVTRYALRPIE